MADSNLTPIEQKKAAAATTTSDDGTQNKWGPFGISILMNIVITLVIGISGANIIYLTNSINNKDSNGISLLERLIPTQEQAYFPPKHTILGGGGGGACSASREYAPNWGLLSNIGVGTTGGFPYSWYNKNDRFSIIQQFINWVVVSTADSYVNNRGLLQKWLTLFARDSANKNIFANETFQMFVLSPFMYLILPLVVIFIHFSSWVSAFKSGVGFTFIGLFLAYSFMLTTGVSVVQTLQYLGMLTVLPLIADFNKIKKIISCNVKSLSFLFGLLLCGSAVTYLDNTIAITMFVSFILMTITSLF
jgi:hypothetical protein